MRRSLLVLALGLAGLVSVVLIRTGSPVSQHLAVSPLPRLAVDTDAIADHLSHAIRFPTISFQDRDGFDSKAFLGLHDYLAQVFPNTHRVLTKETVGEYSLLFTWQGRQQGLKPLLLSAHLDVVPVQTGAGEIWSHPPFAGDVAEGYVWGRGAMDDKVRVLAMLEAVEVLLKEGFSPRRTLVFAFGHDEEVGGYGGAAKIAELLKTRGLRFESVFDEGGLVVTPGVLHGLSRPVALAGIAEKGYMNLEVSVQAQGGHSSVPPSQTAIGILSSAIHRLEEQQFPSRIGAVTRTFAEHLAPEMPFVQRLALHNLWIFDWFVQREFASRPTSNAMIRTTMATTLLRGGQKDNVLPAQARAVVNLRLLPGDAIQAAMERVALIIDDPRVGIRLLGAAHEASPESSVASPSFQVLKQTIHQVFGDVLVAPFLVPGGTDSRHYAELAENILRFSPLLVGTDDLRRIHGADERVAIGNFVQCVQLFYHLVRNMDR